MKEVIIKLNDENSKKFHDKAKSVQIELRKLFN